MHIFHSLKLESRIPHPRSLLTFLSLFFCTVCLIFLIFAGATMAAAADQKLLADFEKRLDSVRTQLHSLKQELESLEKMAKTGPTTTVSYKIQKVQEERFEHFKEDVEATVDMQIFNSIGDCATIMLVVDSESLFSWNNLKIQYSAEYAFDQWLKYRYSDLKKLEYLKRSDSGKGLSACTTTNCFVDRIRLTFHIDPVRFENSKQAAPNSAASACASSS
jgi:hypothetical protein